MRLAVCATAAIAALPFWTAPLSAAEDVPMTGEQFDAYTQGKP